MIEEDKKESEKEYLLKKKGINFQIMIRYILKID